MLSTFIVEQRLSLRKKLILTEVLSCNPRKYSSLMTDDMTTPSWGYNRSRREGVLVLRLAVRERIHFGCFESIEMHCCKQVSLYHIYFHLIRSSKPSEQ